MLTFGVPMQFKLNTDESPSVAAEYGIRSIPTVMFFKDGTKDGHSDWGSPKVNASSDHREVHRLDNPQVV